MQTLASWLLRCYPRRWRDRYGEELGELLERRGVRLRDLVDLARGALDAHVSPQLQPGSILHLAVAGPAPIVPPPRPPAYGVVGGPSGNAMSRRGFLRRVLGAGVGILSLEFLGGTLAFLRPNITEGLGATFRVGTMGEILAAQPSFAAGYPYSFAPARTFLVNIPAARALASGQGASVTDAAAADLLALWRQCPHLGCMVPELCDSVKRFECRCHGSTYNILGEKLDRGPAARGIDRFGVTIEEDGTVVIDTREVIRGAPEGVVTFRDPHPPAVGCG